MEIEQSRSSRSVVLATEVEANAKSVDKVAALPCEESSETFVDDEKFEVNMGSSGSKEAAHDEVLRVLALVRDALPSMFGGH